MRIYHLSILLLFFRTSTALPTIYPSLDGLIKTDGLFNTDTSSYTDNSIRPDSPFYTDNSVNTGNSVYTGSQPVEIGVHTDSINSNEGLRGFIFPNTNSAPASTSSNEVPSPIFANTNSGPSLFGIGQKENNYLAEEPTPTSTKLCFDPNRNIGVIRESQLLLKPSFSSSVDLGHCVNHLISSSQTNHQRTDRQTQSPRNRVIQRPYY